MHLSKNIFCLPYSKSLLMTPNENVNKQCKYILYLADWQNCQKVPQCLCWLQRMQSGGFWVRFFCFCCEKNCWHMWCVHMSFQYNLTVRNHWKITFVQRQPNCIVLGTGLHWWSALTHREADSGHSVQGPSPLLLQGLGGGGHRWHLHPHQWLCHDQAAAGLADFEPDVVRWTAESQLLPVSTVLRRLM